MSDVEVQSGLLRSTSVHVTDTGGSDRPVAPIHLATAPALPCVVDRVVVDDLMAGRFDGSQERATGGDATAGDGLCTTRTLTPTRSPDEAGRPVQGRPRVSELFDAVLGLGTACGVSGAVSAAEELASDLDAVADDLAPAVLADRRHSMDRALEAVERVPLAGRDHLERLVVVVAADLTTRHRVLPCRSVWFVRCSLVPS
jgi:hypothetical protein